MPNIFREEALKYASQRLDGNVILASTLSSKVFAGLLVVSLVTAVYILCNIEVFDTRTFDGQVSAATDPTGFPLVELWIPTETAAHLAPDTHVAVTFKLWHGGRVQAFGRLRGKSRPATALLTRRYGPAKRTRYSSVLVQLDAPSQDQLYQLDRVTQMGDVVGKMEVGRRSIIDRLINRNG